MAVLLVVVSSAGGLADATHVIRHLSVRWVALAIVAVVVRLCCYARQLARLARSSGEMGTTVALGLSLTVYGFGAVTPASPAEGLTIAHAELRRRGRPASAARLILALSEWFTQRTFYAVTALNLLVVVLAGHLAWRGSWPFVLAALAVFVFLAATAFAARRPGVAAATAVLLGALRFGRSRAPADERRAAGMRWHASARATMGPPSNRLRLVLLSAAAVLADAAALWAMCVAAGIHLNPDLVVLAATVGTVASWVPVVPAGIGVVEAVIPSILHHYGAPLDRALAATVAYRAGGTLLPALVGVVAVAWLRRTSHAVRAGRA